MAEPSTPETEQTTDSDQSNPVGRPLKFKNPEELEVAIEAYFDDCDPHVESRLVRQGTTIKGKAMFEMQDVLTEQKPYTMFGLARTLGIDRKTLLNYKNRDEFFPSIQSALDRCAEYAESQLFVGNSTGARFSLTNNFDWHEKQEVDHTSAGQPIKALVEFVGDGAPEASQD